MRDPSKPKTTPHKVKEPSAEILNGNDCDYVLRCQHEGSSTLPCCGWGRLAAGPSRALASANVGFSLLYNIILSGKGVVSSADAVTVELPSVIKRQLESVFRPSSI